MGKSDENKSEQMTEAIHELLKAFDRVGNPKVIPRVRPAAPKEIKAKLIKFLTDQIGGQCVRPTERNTEMSIIAIPKHNPEVVDLPKAFQSPPEAMHPGQIDYASFGDNAALKRASDALQYGWNEALAINTLRANPHDEDRAATHDRKVCERVDAFDRSFAETFDNANADLKAELRAVEAELERKAGLKPNPAHFDAITASFHGMKPELRMATISDLIAQGDHASLATLIEAPLFLTGLTAEVRDAIKTRVLNKVDPQAVALSDQLKLAIERMDNASYASLPMRAQLRAGTGQGEWKERAKQAAVRAAADNFTRR